MDIINTTEISIFIPSLLIMAGVCFFASINQVIIWVRQKEKLAYLLFAFMSFFAGLYIIQNFLLYLVDSVEHAIRAVKFRDFIIPLFYISLFWFLYEYIDKRKGLFFYGIVGLSLFTFIATFFMPTGHMIGNVNAIYEKTLPWGETINRLDVEFNYYLGSISALISILSAGFLIFSGWTLNKRKDKIMGLPFILCGLLWLFTGINDSLMDANMINSIYLSEFLVFGIILILSNSLSYEWYLMNVKYAEKEIALLKVKKESEERYRAFFKTARDGAFVTNMDGRFIDFNSGFVEMFGYNSKDELKAVNAKELYFNAEDRNSVIQSITDKGFIAHLPLKLKKKDGSQIDALMTSSVIKNDKGEVEALQGTVTDITQRKIAEDLVKENSERLQLALEAAQMGTWDWNIQNNTVYWSSETMKIFGTSPEKFEGTLEAYVKFVAPEMQEAVSKKVEDFLKDAREGSIIHYEHKTVKGTGEIGWVEVRGMLTMDKNGQPSHMIGVVVDISERKRIEKELRVTQLHYIDFMNSSSDVVSYWKADEGIRTDLPFQEQIELLSQITLVDVNRSGYETYGFKNKDDVIGKKLSELFSQKTQKKAFSEFINNNYNLNNVELYEVTINGKEVYSLVNWFGIVEDGLLKVIWTNSKNITELVYAKNELEKHRDNLEELVKERTSEVKEKQRLMDLLMDTVPDNVYFKDIDSKFIMANKATVEKLGFKSESELLGKSDSDVFGADHSKEALNDERQIIKSGKPVLNKIEEEDWQDGHKTWALTSKMPLIDENGKITGTFGITRDITESIQNEKALKKAKETAEELNRELSFTKYAVEHAVDAATWIDPNTSRLFYVNKATALWTGYEVEELLGKPISLIDPNYTMDVWPDFRNKIKRGKPLQFESSFLSKSGEHIPIEVTAQYVKYGDEDRVVAFCRNITERKQAELALQNANEKLELAIEAAELGIWDWDVEQNLTSWSNKLFEIYNLPHEVPMPYKKWARAVHPDDLPGAEEWLQNIFETKKKGFSEFRVVRPDESVRHIYGGAVPLTDETGKVIRVIGINMDITERKLSEKTMRYALDLSQKTGDMSEEEMLKAFLNEAVRLTSSRIGFFHFVDTDKQIVELKTWTGAVMEECEVEEVRPGYPIAEAGIWVECIESKKPVIHNYYEKEPNRKGLPEGHVPLMRDMEVPVIENGKVVAIIGVGNKDIEYVQSDLDRLAFLATNAWGNIRRTRAVADIKEARVAAETANRAKSVFLANMSHEIRTPMNAILGHSQIMQRDESLKEEQKMSIVSINKSGEHLLSLINDILDMSKIEAGKIKVLPVSFQLHHLLNEMYAMFLYRVNQKGIVFNLNIDPGLPKVIHADVNRVRQILINLLGNAVKFTDEGEITLIGKLKNKKIILEIEDTGCGIHEDHLETIFAAFEQTGKGMREQSGTGLGLAISRNMARLMRGEIIAKSKIGKGSTFSFSFDYVKGRKKLIDDKVTKAKVKKLKPGQKNARLLIVDDRLENRIVASKLLKEIGFLIREAENGKEAVELTKKWKPKVIIMDVVMPVMDGREATRKIRELYSSEEVTIIALSASALDEEREEIMNTGADAFVKKPFKETELLNEINKQAGIEYVYEELKDEKKSAVLKDFTIEDIKRIPTGLRKKIKQAVVVGNIDQLKVLINDVAKTDPNIADYLKELVEGFELDKMNKLFQ